MIPTENFILLMLMLLIIGAFLLWRHGTKCYDRGITDAILLHRNGRLKYETYLDDDGEKMVNIEIEPLPDED
jgi:hypothetical protein|tara:strand:+ start:506 stop:721 length:216 start_codon:yes stop_codon:yes gene_type:complete